MNIEQRVARVEEKLNVDQSPETLDVEYLKGSRTMLKASISLSQKRVKYYGGK